MTRSWSSWRPAAIDSVSVLVELLEDPGTSDRRLVLGYLEAKRTLAEAFEAFAVEKYADPAPFGKVRELLEHAMRTTYVSLPDKYLRVRGFGAVHELLLAFFDSRVGSEVSADELRMLTGDAVHTERRARDLRSMGFQLDAYDSGGISVYVLRDTVPDVARGAAQLVARNIRDDKALSRGEQEKLLVDSGLN